MKSAKRTLLILAGGVLLLFLLVVVLGQSDLFLRWLVQRPVITKFVDLNPADLRGDLFGPIEIDRATLQGPGWRIELQGFALAWQPIQLVNRRWVVNQLVAQQVNVALDSSDQTSGEPKQGWNGFLSPIDIELRQVSISELTTQPPGEPEGRLENIAITVGLVGNRVTLQHLAAQHPRGSATATGSATLSANLPVDLELDWRLAEQPMDITGHAAVSGDLQKLGVVVQTNGDVVARSNATIDLIAEPLTVDANLRVERIQENTFNELVVTAKGWLSSEQQLSIDLDWRGLTWPTAAVSWQSPQGHLEVTGRFDNLNLRGNADAVVQLPNEPEARWQLTYRAQVAPSLITINEATILGDGSATLYGSYDLSSATTNFAAEISAFNPGLFAPQWPGTISGTVSANGNSAGWNAQIEALTGELRGESLMGQGQLRVGPGDLTAADASGSVQLNWAGISTQLQGGRTDQRWQLSLDQQITELGKLDPRFAGIANITASLVGDNAAPTLTLELSTNLLAYQEQPFATINAGLTGIVSADGFRGELQRLGLANDWLDAQLQSSTPLKLTRTDGNVDGFSLEGACLAGDGADFCISATTAASSTDLQIEIQALQLALLDPFLPGLQAHGQLSGAADLQFVDSQVAGGGQFALTQGSLTTGQEQSRLLNWRAVTATVTADGTSLTGQVDGDLGDTDTLVMDLSLTGPQLAQLNGRVTANTKQLNALRIVLPEVKPVVGELHANLTLGGTLANPVVNGQVGLRDAALEVIDLGITLEQARLLATLATGGLSIDASAEVDEGSLTLNGALTSLEPLGGEFTLQTENLRFINSPEAELFADATLTARIAEPRVAVTGQVNIPRGHIKAVPSSAVSVSDDQVIVGQLDRPDSSEPWRATGALQLNIGPELSLNAVGVTGNISGTLELTLPEEGSASGNGEIKLSDGNFEVFRQVLEIQRGGLVFSGGPVANPGLDIRASRQIGEQTVGVLARGPAGNPVIELFAEPALSTADTLSYLTLGKPVNNLAENEQGMVNRASDQVALSGGNLVAAQLGRRLGLDETSIEGTLDNASLVLGKYLSPRLYVSYGIGLAQATDFLKLRFQLSRRWSLQAESGVTSGADLVYSIDR